MKRYLPEQHEYKKRLRLVLDQNEQSQLIKELQYDCINLSFLDSDMLDHFRDRQFNTSDNKVLQQSSLPNGLEIDSKNQFIADNHQRHPIYAPSNDTQHSNTNYKSELSDLNQFIENLESDLDQIDHLVLQKFNSLGGSSSSHSINSSINSFDSIDSNSSYYDESFDNDSIFTINDL